MRPKWFYDFPGAHVLVPDMQGAPEDVKDAAEDAVFENSWGYRSKTSFESAKKYRTSDRFTPRPRGHPLSTYEGWFTHSHNHVISMQPLGVGNAFIPHMKPL